LKQEFWKLIWPDTFHLNPNDVRAMQFWHQPPGRERVRVTVEYTTGEMKVLIIQKSLLAGVPRQLYATEGGA
jgi:hypothetical protein